MASLSEIHYQDWKSFRDAKLYIDQISVLIGANAGGKSNALDGLIFLSRIANGSMLTTALQGDTLQNPIRGGVDWAARIPKTDFTLGATIRDGELVDYIYEISCSIHNNRCDVKAEELKRKKYRPKKDGKRGAPSGEINLYKTDACVVDQPNIVARLYNEKRGTPRQLSRSNSVIFQLVGQKYRQEIQDGVDAVISSFRNIFILDPIPSHMRGFSSLSDRLEPDAGNIAGVIAALGQSQKQDFDNAIRKYATKLPEQEIGRIFAETVGKFKTDAMLYCEESWGAVPENLTIVDARGMSDGTLRFLGILTALLTRPENSLLVIEEVDNGLHPSRAQLLLNMLLEIGGIRKVDVLVTTHNPALLDAMGTDLIPFIIVAHRNRENGESELTLLEDIRLLPKMLAIGTVGKLSSKGIIEKIVRNENPQLVLGL